MSERPIQREKKQEPEYNGHDDFVKSITLGFAHIRDRMAAGGPGWKQGGE